MKKSIVLAMGSIFVFVACQKSSITPSFDVKSITNLSHAAAKKSNFELLTAHPWMYYKYYTGYVDSSNLGTLIYKRGRHDDAIDLDHDFATFNQDGTVDEYYNGAYIPGTWSFFDNEQTIIQVINYIGVYAANIVELNANHYKWYYADIYGVERYAVEITKCGENSDSITGN